MSKASWLPAHVYGNGYVGIGGCLLTTPTTETWAFGSSSIYERFAYLGACCDPKLTRPRLPLFSLSPYGVLYVFIINN